jgi:RNA polymerase primary sigma factor
MASSALYDEASQRLIRQAKDAPYLAKDEDIKLGRIIKKGGPKGEQARDRLILSHMRLVVKAALKYGWSGKPLSDMLMAGNIGLIKAADRYEPKKGFHFATYAQWWVRAELDLVAFASSDVTNVPQGAQRRMRKIAAAQRDLRKSGIEPTDELIAKRVGLSSKVVHRLRQILESLNQTHLSIDDNFPGTDLKIGEAVADPNTVDPDAALEKESRTELLTKALSILDERQRDIVQSRFGLAGFEVQTLEELAERYGITRERIRQIEQSSLRKLAKGPHKHVLRSLFQNLS